MRTLLICMLLSMPGRDASAGSIGDVGGGGGGTTGADTYDLGSLIPSRLELPVWSRDDEAVARYPGMAADGEGFERVVYINPARVSAGTRMRVPFLVPAGVTQVTLTAPAMRPENAAFSGALSRARIMDGIGTTELAGVDLNTTSTTISDFTISLAVTAGQQRFVEVQLLGADFLAKVGRIRLTYTGGTGVFASSVARYAITPEVLHSNCRTDAVNGHFKTSAGSRFIIDTTADSFVVESMADEAFSSGPSNIMIYVNGDVMSTTLASGLSSNVMKHNTVTLPTALAGKLKRVEVVQGHREQTVVNTGSVTGHYMQAIYVPSSALTQIVYPSTKAPRALMIGDSTSIGTGSSQGDGRGAVAAMVRRLRPEYDICLDGIWGGNSLAEIASTSVKVAAYMATWRQWQPEVVVFHVGTNDYGANTMTTAAFGAAYGAMVDAMKEAWPGVRIKILTPTERTVETANAGGNTLPDFRTAITTMATSRGLPTPIDGLALITTNDLSDTVHLSNSDVSTNPPRAGVEKVGQALADAMRDMAVLAFLPDTEVSLTVTAATAPTARFNRVSSSGAVAWVPALAGKAGDTVTACNVNAADAITMTDGSTYEGAGTVLGANDCVTFRRDTTTGKWREVGASNN